MKKFFLVLFLFILLAVGIFLLGFMQLRLAPGQQAIIHTKTQGWHSDIVQHGEITWMWQSLLPTNLTLVRFQDAPQTHIHQHRLKLPSWEVYGQGLPSSAFEFSFTFSLTYQFLEAYYLEIFDHFFHPDGEASDEVALDTIAVAHEQVALEIQRRLFRVSEQLLHQVSSQLPLNDFELIALRQTFYDSILESFNQIPGLNILSSGLTQFDIPDFELYYQLRNSFFENQRILSERLSEIEIELASTERTQEARFSLLRSYGEILTQFPGLLDYFRILGEVGVDPLSLEESLR